MIFDARCLENPFWVEELKPLSGLDAPVREYIFSNPDSLRYAQALAEVLKLQIQLAEKRACERLVVAVGCTGGRHRSVAITEFLAQALSEYSVEIDHRDIKRG